LLEKFAFVVPSWLVVMFNNGMYQPPKLDSWSGIVKILGPEIGTIAEIIQAWAQSQGITEIGISQAFIVESC
jgi:hypothetical protein